VLNWAFIWFDSKVLQAHCKSCVTTKFRWVNKFSGQKNSWLFHDFFSEFPNVVCTIAGYPEKVLTQRTSLNRLSRRVRTTENDTDTVTRQMRNTITTAHRCSGDDRRLRCVRTAAAATAPTWHSQRAAAAAEGAVPLPCQRCSTSMRRGDDSTGNHRRAIRRDDCVVVARESLTSIVRLNIVAAELFCCERYISHRALSFTQWQKNSIPRPRALRHLHVDEAVVKLIDP